MGEFSQMQRVMDRTSCLWLPWLAVLDLSASFSGGPRKGLVTRLNRLAQATPLVKVGKACHAGRTARHPDGLLTISGRAAN